MVDRPKNKKFAKDMYRLARAIRRTLREASLNYPDGGSKELKREWCRITTIMIIELVKRRTIPYRNMLKNAHQVVKRRLEREAVKKMSRVRWGDLTMPDGVDKKKDKHSEPE